MIKGTSIREVTEARLLAERKLLEEADLSRPQDAEKRLQELADAERAKRRSRRAGQPHGVDRANLIHDYAQGIAQMLAEEVDAGAAEQWVLSAADGGAPAEKPAKYAPAPATPLTRTTEAPAWAEDCANLRGKLPLSRNHFTAVVAIRKGAARVVLEGLIDTAGARSMIDLDTAKLAGLPLTYPTANRSLGWFHGPSGVPTAYSAIVEGPVELQFTSDIRITLPELKVVTSRDPLLLVGSDLMKIKDQRWRFVYMGYDLRTQAGVLKFGCGKGQRLGLRTVPLFCWPTPAAAAATASTQAAA